jgi:hypothetical protein
MAILLLEAGMATENRTTAQLRKLIRRAFPDAQFRQQFIGPLTVLEVDGWFAVMRSDDSDDLWAVCDIVHREAARTPRGGSVPHSVEYPILVELPAEEAVAWVVMQVAQGRMNGGEVRL